MKKSIFAVAVTSVLTLGAAHAETVLYGSIRYDYESRKVEDTLVPHQNAGGTNYTWEGKRLSNLSDAGSRIGIKGSEDLGNGNAVIYNLEWGFDGMTQDESKGGKNRLAILGLTGDWGTFTAGRQHNPFKVTIVDDTVVDNFNGSHVATSAAQRAMTSTLNGAETINSASYSRVGKVIAYTTPNWAGFQANVALMMDSSLYATNNEKNIDLWTINARYAYELGADGTLLAKAGYIQGKLADVNKSKAWGLFLGYEQSAFGVSFDYANGNHTPKSNTINAVAGDKQKSQGWDLGGRFSFGPNYYSSIRATYGQNQVKVDGHKDKVKSWAVGFEQKLSSRTRAWVEYGQEETKFAEANVDKKKDNTISVGMRHDF